MTYQMMMLMEAKMFGNPEDMKNFSQKLPAKWACIFACLCHLRCCGGSIKNKFLKRHNLENDKPDKFLKMIEDKMGSNNFLGGDQASVLDLSLYGMLYQFSSEPKAQSVKELEDHSPQFKEWLGRMTALVGQIKS